MVVAEAWPTNITSGCMSDMMVCLHTRTPILIELQLLVESAEIMLTTFHMELRLQVTKSRGVQLRRTLCAYWQQDTLLPPECLLLKISIHTGLESTKVDHAKTAAIMLEPSIVGANVSDRTMTSLS